MADIFQTSVSGMLAFQRALATTSHNISNVNTEGYSRQRTALSTLTPTPAGGGWVGTGVGVESIRRLADDNRLASVRTNSSEYNRLETFAELNGRIDNLLADKDAGLSPALQAFFNSVQQAASDPTSPTSRNVMLTEAGNLASRFHYIESRLSELEGEVNHRIEVAVDEVNEMAAAVARLNQDIAVALGRSQGAPPNDLLDQRDLLLEKISERITTQVVPAEGGSVNVFIGNGQALVVGAQYNSLTTVANATDPARREIAFVANGSTVNVTRNLSGGSLGGLLDFRRESLDVISAELGEVASALAQEFNDQHRLGASFDGGTMQRGGDFFSFDPANPARTLQVALTRPSQIAWANPALTGEWTDATGQSVNTGTGEIGPARVEEGVELNTPTGFRSIEIIKTVTGYDALVTAGDGTTTPAAVTEAGGELEIPVAGGSIFVPIAGAPDEGDRFAVELNLNGRGDNANLRELAALRNEKVLNGGDATLQEFYSGIVGRVGTQSLRANVNRDAQEVLLGQAVAYRDEVSGVNLEEEAADMLRYQQAFQASAQLVTVANSVFQSLLSAVGR
jgi:flagellar hook-associated protein 1 FlgK